MYRTVDTATWGDPWFEELAPLAKLVFLYLLTNSRTASCGAYPITLRTISNETCLAAETVSTVLGEFGDRVVWWPEEHFVFIRNFYRYQRANSSDKYRVGAMKQTEDLPAIVQERVWSVYPELRPAAIPYRYPTNTLSDETDTVSLKQNKTETDQNTAKAEHTPRIRTVASEPDGFADFYAAYPRHDARQPAVKAYARLTVAERERAVTALPAWKACPQWQDPQYVPQASTYLNERRYNDDPPRASPNGNGRKPVDRAMESERFGTRTIRKATGFGATS